MTTTDVELDVPLIGQQTAMWCWATSAQMILAHAGRQVTQCEQVNSYYGFTDACVVPTPEHTVLGGWPEFGKLGFSHQETPEGDALAFHDLKAEIDAGRPFAFSWKWGDETSEDGHMMVAVGYRESDEGQFVHVNDPLPMWTGDASLMPYANFVGGDDWQGPASPHVHWKDHFLIRPLPAGGPAPSASAPAAPLVPTAASPGGATERGVEILQQIASEHPGSRLVDTDLSSGLEVGEHFRATYLHRRALLESSGEDLQAAFASDHERVVPVRSRGEVVSSVVVARREGAWALTRVGSPNLTRALIRARSRGVAEGFPIEGWTAVFAPHLQAVFLRHEDDGELRTVLDPSAPRPSGPGARLLRHETVDSLRLRSVRAPFALPPEDRAT